MEDLRWLSREAEVGWGAVGPGAGLEGTGESSLRHQELTLLLGTNTIVALCKSTAWLLVLFRGLAIQPNMSTSVCSRAANACWPISPRHAIVFQLLEVH